MNLILDLLNVKIIDFMYLFYNSANSSTKKDEGNEAQAKASKPNPFGGAVPRDENEYLKKKEVMI